MLVHIGAVTFLLKPLPSTRYTFTSWDTARTCTLTLFRIDNFRNWRTELALYYHIYSIKSTGEDITRNIMSSAADHAI